MTVVGHSGDILRTGAIKSPSWSYTKTMASGRITDSTPPPDAATDPLWYWWHTCRGAQAMRAFQAAPESEAWGVIHRNPVLLLPELVDAAERTLGKSRAIDGLRQMHQSLRQSPLFAPYHRLLANALSTERAGSRRINLERALAVMKLVRAVAEPADRAADEKLETAIRAGLDALTPVPGAKPLPAEALFLDGADLDNYRRTEDHRSTNPTANDRPYATHGGLAAGSAIWIANDDVASVHRVVDARWLFASSKHAKAYMDSPSTLFVAGDGLPNPAVLPMGDGAHAWGAARGPRQCLLFRIERVVAKLDVTEGPKAAAHFQPLTRALLQPIADAVSRRARFVLAQYWLAIGRGTEAAQKFQTASPRVGQQLLVEYPILLLPEFPTAMISLGEQFRGVAQRLANAQAEFKSNWHGYRDTMRTLVRMLLDEQVGERRVNADAALRLVIAHRRLDSDYSWAALETECAAAVLAKPA